MEEEFRVYGLSREAMSRVKLAKLASATAVLVGIWYSPLAQVGALCMALLMLAAVLMHVRIHDPIRKSLPAASLLLLSLFVLVNQ
jgi:hypothetical protein